MQLLNLAKSLRDNLNKGCVETKFETVRFKIVNHKQLLRHGWKSLILSLTKQVSHKSGITVLENAQNVWSHKVSVFV